ncbi:MAG: hypothetical protein AB7Q45_26860, partial [Planctomycetaceae bacterium]
GTVLRMVAKRSAFGRITAAGASLSGRLPIDGNGSKWVPRGADCKNRVVSAEFLKRGLSKV